MIFAAANEPGLFYVGSPDPVDIEAYAMRPMSGNLAERISAYAKENGLSGWIELEMIRQPEGYYIPAIPGQE